MRPCFPFVLVLGTVTACSLPVDGVGDQQLPEPDGGTDGFVVDEDTSSEEFRIASGSRFEIGFSRAHQWAATVWMDPADDAQKNLAPPNGVLQWPLSLVHGGVVYGETEVVSSEMVIVESDLDNVTLDVTWCWDVDGVLVEALARQIISAAGAWAVQVRLTTGDGGAFVLDGIEVARTTVRVDDVTWSETVDQSSFRWQRDGLPSTFGVQFATQGLNLDSAGPRDRYWTASDVSFGGSGGSGLFAFTNTLLSASNL